MLHAYSKKSQENFSLCTNFEIFQKSSIKIKIFLHILIVPIMYESGKVKNVMSNKIGLTIYSWTLWYVPIWKISDSTFANRKWYMFFFIPMLCKKRLQQIWKFMPQLQFGTVCCGQDQTRQRKGQDVPAWDGKTPR